MEARNFGMWALVGIVVVAMCAVGVAIGFYPYIIQVHRLEQDLTEIKADRVELRQRIVTLEKKVDELNKTIAATPTPTPTPTPAPRLRATRRAVKPVPETNHAVVCKKEIDELARLQDTFTNTAARQDAEIKGFEERQALLTTAITEHEKAEKALDKVLVLQHEALTIETDAFRACATERSTLLTDNAILRTDNAKLKKSQKGLKKLGIVLGIAAGVAGKVLF